MLSTCTIPSDPGYESSRSVRTGRISSLEIAPRPRVRPEAMRNAAKNQGCVAQLFNPYAKPMGVGRQGFAPGAQPKDFAKENYLKIKQMQRANKQKQSEPSREPLKAVHKPGKFDHVESKVGEKIKETPQAPRPSSATFLRAHSRSGPVVRDRPKSVEPVIPREFKLTVPKAAIAKEHQPVRTNENIISRNIKRSATPTHKRAPSALAAEELTKKKEEEIKTYKKGKVPTYLRKRQDQWKHEEEERIRNTPDPSIPPGHKLMPADERCRTLEVLQTSQRELTLQLNSLPISQDTMRVRNRRSELEQKLAEIEAAIKIFSRPKVFVKIDT